MTDKTVNTTDILLYQITSCTFQFNWYIAIQLRNSTVASISGYKEEHPEQSVHGGKKHIMK